MAMDTTGTETADDMKRGIIFLAMIECLDKRGILKEHALLDVGIDARPVLDQDSSRADRRMSNFAVAEFSPWQTYNKAGCNQTVCGIAVDQRVEIGHARLQYRIAWTCRSETEAVKNNEQNFFIWMFHRSNIRAIHPRGVVTDSFLIRGGCISAGVARDISNVPLSESRIYRPASSETAIPLRWPVAS